MSSLDPRFSHVEHADDAAGGDEHTTPENELDRLDADVNTHRGGNVTLGARLERLDRLRQIIDVAEHNHRRRRSRRDPALDLVGHCWIGRLAPADRIDNRRDGYLAGMLRLPSLDRAKGLNFHADLVGNHALRETFTR